MHSKHDPVLDLQENTIDVETSIKRLIKSYQDLNNSIVDELKEQPTPLEFMRYVARNRPFVVRGGIRRWKAVREWNVQYLKQAMENKQVNVAHTPNGWVSGAVPSKLH